MAERKSRRAERESDVRDLYERAGRHLSYALKDYANAKRLMKAGQSAAAATYRDSGRRYVSQAKRFAREALAKT